MYVSICHLWLNTKLTNIVDNLDNIVRIFPWAILCFFLIFEAEIKIMVEIKNFTMRKTTINNV